MGKKFLLKDFLGKKFGSLTIIGQGSPVLRNGKVKEERWLCECECGKQKEILKYRILHGKTLSCGCLISKTNKKLKQNKKGFNNYCIQEHKVCIYLNKNQTCFIDIEDLPLVSQYRWHCSTQNYAMANIKLPDTKKTKSIFMHQLIMNDKNIDHIDGNKLNNCRNNLRKFVENWQNVANSTKRKNNTTGYIGVTKRGSGYCARVRHNKKTVLEKICKTAEEAAMLRDLKVLEIFGEYAKLNFPLEEVQKARKERI